MKALRLWLVSILLCACNGSPVTDEPRIMLHVYRGDKGPIPFLFETATYTVSGDGAGKVSMPFPAELGKTSTAPKWSPNGQWVAFVDNNALKVIHTSGTLTLSFVSYVYRDSTLSWSPEGTRLIFDSRSSQRPGVYIVDIGCLLRGEICKPKETFLVDGRDAEWSPDGKQIVYQERVAGAGQVFLMNADGTGTPKLLPNVKGCYTPRWSPDGLRIVLNCPKSVTIINADGSNQVEVGVRGFDAQWSPDGQRISFIARRDPELSDIPLNIEGGVYADAVYSMNLDGSDIIRLSKRNDEAVNWHTWLPIKDKK